MQRLVLALSAMATATSLLTPAFAESESERLRQWLDERYEEELAFSPLELTELGRKQQYDAIDDFSEAAEDEQLAWQRQTVGALREAFDYEALDAEAKVSYDYWLYRFERAREQVRWRRHRYLLEQVTAQHVWLPQILINYHRVDTVQDMEDYIARLSGVARALGQLQARAAKAAGEGIRPPRFAYDIVLEQCRGVISGAPFDSGKEGAVAPLWADVLDKTRALETAGIISAGQRQSLREAARNALLRELQPAYQALIAYLEADRDKSPDPAEGVHRLPDGELYYQHRLRQYTTTDLGADAIHELGLAEVARIRGEMEALRQRVGFEGSLDAFFDFVRTDEQFYFPDTEAGRQAYLDETRRYLGLIEDRLPAYFGILPRTQLEVRRVESFRERDGAGAFYEQGTPDGTRPGVYYLHLSDMRANNRTDLQTTAYHEGSPGHHMQVSIALEREDLPLFRTNVWYSAYGEGWALYAERLAWEMGLYDNAYYDFGRLGAEIFRAIRLVVDTGLHARGWSQERAVRYMLANSAMPEAAARSEIQRYLVWPGQATSYKIGMLKLLELRERASEILGEDFDIRGFHDLVLGGGALPLSILERRVDDWIAAGG
jgi:uncharacterized protein (DUF885 family)